MNQDLLNTIKVGLRDGSITPADLKNILEQSQGSSNFKNKHSSFKLNSNSSDSLLKVLYGIGAAILLVGVIILVIQNWNDIGFIGRIAVTLGISIVAFLIGLFVRSPDQRMVSEISFLVSVCLVPIGVFVFLDNAQIVMTNQLQAFVGLCLSFMYVAAYFVSKKEIPAYAILGFFSWAYIEFVLSLSSQVVNGDAFYYLIMMLGVIQLVAATLFLPIRRFFQSIGLFTILLSGIIIGGGFGLFYFILIFAGFYLSVFLKRRSLFTISAIFLTAHIIKITSKYFADSIGWPVSLIVIGMSIIAIGYVTVRMNKKLMM
jgi:hypothetical protein